MHNDFYAFAFDAVCALKNEVTAFDVIGASLKLNIVAIDIYPRAVRARGKCDSSAIGTERAAITSAR